MNSNRSKTSLVSGSKRKIMARTRRRKRKREKENGAEYRNRLRWISLDPVCRLPGEPGTRESGTVTFPACTWYRFGVDLSTSFGHSVDATKARATRKINGLRLCGPAAHVSRTTARSLAWGTSFQQP